MLSTLNVHPQFHGFRYIDYQLLKEEEKRVVHCGGVTLIVGMEGWVFSKSMPYHIGDIEKKTHPL